MGGPFDEHNEISSIKDALAVVALGAAASDGTVSSDERFRFVALALGSRLFPNDIDEIIAEATRLAHYVSVQGIEKSLKTAGRLLPGDLKETAFAWAVDIVIADVRIVKEEKDYLELIMSEFGIEKEMAEKIVEVTKIRNRVH